MPSAQTGEWANPYNTQYASIYYLNDSDLNTFTRSIGKGFTFFGESQEKNPMLAKNRVDAIVERVRRLLDMYPPNLHFKVYIYPTYRELGLKYLGTGNFGKSPIAFYNHKTAAIYISLPDITGGVLAHEIAHTVINFFFAVPPPTAMQEILAQYVDRHLWEE
ncbi:MAG: hypothetical protein HZB54_06490 [Deltaproteobacteria bacterium]|nr:hypothetical protein [Deltaproteobacteria bacterium]